MRTADSYRGARKRKAKSVGADWADTMYRKIDIRRPTEQAKGKALPLKAAFGGERLTPSESTPGKFVFAGETERLKSVAIRRGDIVHARDKCFSHRELRQRIDPDNRLGIATSGDIEGFVTSSGRFVDRREGAAIALDCGQIREHMVREIVSSDINW